MALSADCSLLEFCFWLYSMFFWRHFYCPPLRLVAMSQAASVDISAFQKHCWDMKIYHLSNNNRYIHMTNEPKEYVLFFQMHGVKHIGVKLLSVERYCGMKICSMHPSFIYHRPDSELAIIYGRVEANNTWKYCEWDKMSNQIPRLKIMLRRNMPLCPLLDQHIWWPYGPCLVQPFF